jgi:hypothetical protein
VVAHVNAAALPEGWRPRFRLSERCTVHGAGLTVLLFGADTESARLALLRAGLPATTVDGPGVRIAVARPVDLIAPELGSFAAVSASRADDANADSTLVG